MRLFRNKFYFYTWLPDSAGSGPGLSFGMTILMGEERLATFFNLPNPEDNRSPRVFPKTAYFDLPLKP